MSKEKKSGYSGAEARDPTGSIGEESLQMIRMARRGVPERARRRGGRRENPRPRPGETAQGLSQVFGEEWLQVTRVTSKTTGLGFVVMQGMQVRGTKVR